MKYLKALLKEIEDLQPESMSMYYNSSLHQGRRLDYMIDITVFGARDDSGRSTMLTIDNHKIKRGYRDGWNGKTFARVVEGGSEYYQGKPYFGARSSKMKDLFAGFIMEHFARLSNLRASITGDYWRAQNGQ